MWCNEVNPTKKVNLFPIVVAGAHNPRSFYKRREVNTASFFSRRLVYLVVAVAIRVALLL